MDGFQLLSYISKNYKGIPVIVITAFGTPEIENEIQKRGSFQFLEKPLDFNILEEKISEGLKAKLKGYVKGISLSSFIQVLGMEGASCTLTVKSKEKAGYLYFFNGVLIDADFGDKKGEEAAYDIIVWDDVEIEIERKSSKREKEINMSLNHIIMEAHRRMDENKNKQDDRIVLENNTGHFLNSQFKEENMNIKKLQDAIKILKDDLGDGLLATDVWMSTDGQPIAGYNSQPKACALFNRITLQMNRTLKDSGFPLLGQYYLLDLADKKLVIILPLGDYMWGMLIDGTITPLGLILNIALPKVIDAFESAITG